MSKKIKANKTRDYVTMREITNGSGVGSHKSKKDYDRKKLRREDKEMVKYA